jgi:hypothetical protein
MEYLPIPYGWRPMRCTSRAKLGSERKLPNKGSTFRSLQPVVVRSIGRNRAARVPRHPELAKSSHRLHPVSRYSPNYDGATASRLYAANRQLAGRRGSASQVYVAPRLGGCREGVPPSPALPRGALVPRTPKNSNSCLTTFTNPTYIVRATNLMDRGFRAFSSQDTKNLG